MAPRILALATSVILLARAGAAADVKPNVIVILVDDLGYAPPADA